MLTYIQVSFLFFIIRVPVRVKNDRRLADGNVNCDGSATYQICFRLPIPNPKPYN